MSEDEEVLRKGSVLYNYLQDNGFSNFESYEYKNQSTMKFPLRVDKSFNSSSIPTKAPHWTTSNLNCFLKSGLILEDHRHFLEHYYPLETEEYSKSKFNIRLCSVPLLCLGGGLWRLAQTPVSKVLLVASAALGSFYAAYRIRENWKRKYFSLLTSKIQLTLVGLEKLFVQYKRMLQLIHQNDFISQKISLGQNEMLELKRKLRKSLLGAIEVLVGFSDELKKIPLSIEINATLRSPSSEMIHNGLNFGDEESNSFENLKKLFNSYILVQSEFLRGFALCHCPDLWDPNTSHRILLYCQNVLPEIITWSSDVHKSLLQEQKLYRAVIESKNKGSQLRAHTSSSWDYSDIYVSVRSACVHFQSLLIQTQGLQEILENAHNGQTKDCEELLNASVQILTEISREIHLGQICVDASLAQIFKMSNPCQPPIKPNELEDSSLTIEDPEQTFNSAYSAPVQDEIFELTVHHDDSDWSDDGEWNDIAEYSIRKKEGETSKIVLEELKTVLVKKAEEWKEREKRAMESKGIPYTAPEQVDSPSHEYKAEEGKTVPNTEEVMDFLPTNSQNNWPLPRLKGNLKTHRSMKGKRPEEVAIKPLEPMMSDDPIDKEDKMTENTRLGFGASLLAEAMAKSKAMQRARQEEIFHDSENEFSESE